MPRSRASKPCASSPGAVRNKSPRALASSNPPSSKIERQTDLYLSTLRRFVEAAGGTLELRVELPGTGVIHLTGMGELNARAA